MKVHCFNQKHLYHKDFPFLECCTLAPNILKNLIHSSNNSFIEILKRLLNRMNKVKT